MKRVSASDTADIGFAIGTTGGVGGSTVTVTSLAALTSAVAGTAKKTVLVSGTLHDDPSADLRELELTNVFFPQL